MGPRLPRSSSDVALESFHKQVRAKKKSWSVSFLFPRKFSSLSLLADTRGRKAGGQALRFATEP